MKSGKVVDEIHWYSKRNEGYQAHYALSLPLFALGE